MRKTKKLKAGNANREKLINTKTYSVELDFNEIHLILNLLDDFIENQNDLASKTEAVGSISEKLEQLHWQHIKEARTKLLK